MTELQKVRKSLMAQLEKIESGEYDEKHSNSVVNISNSVIKSYNVELRADELKVSSKSKVNKNIQNKVFDNEA